MVSFQISIRAQLTSNLESQASLLRQIVAGPRLKHPEAGLDLCYVTDNSNIPHAARGLHDWTHY